MLLHFLEALSVKITTYNRSNVGLWWKSKWWIRMFHIFPLQNLCQYPKRTSITSLGGPIAPAYVHVLIAVNETKWASKEGNLSFSRSSTAMDVDGDVVDKMHCAGEQIGSLLFAADLNKAITVKVMCNRCMTLDPKHITVKRH